jgi:hypothetical protein
VPEGNVEQNDGRATHDRQRMLEQEELSAAITRFRRGSLVGYFVWFTFFGADVLVNSAFELHRLGTFLALRLLAVPLCGFRPS